MLLNAPFLSGKSFMPSLDKIRKKVEDAVNNDKTKTLADFLREKNNEIKNGVIVFHNNKDSKKSDEKVTLVWATQKDFANILVDAYKKSQTDAKNILMLKIQEQYKQQAYEAKPFKADIDKEMSFFSVMATKDAIQQEQFDTLVAITFIARQVL